MIDDATPPGPGRTAIELVADDPLHQRLTEIDQHLLATEPDYIRLAAAFVARLKAARAGETAPGIGEKFPELILPSTSGVLVRLPHLRPGLRSVVAFLRGHWCPYCRAHGDALRETLDALAADNVRVTLITPEMAHFSSAFGADNPDLEILCDMDHGAATLCGLTTPAGPALVDYFKSDGIDLPRYHGNSDWLVPIPATFVLDEEGRVIARSVDTDFRTRMAISTLRAALRAPPPQAATGA